MTKLYVNYLNLLNPEAKTSLTHHSPLLLFLLDVFLAGVAQASLPLSFTTATALLGVLLTVCKIIVGHNVETTITIVLFYYYENKKYKKHN